MQCLYVTSSLVIVTNDHHYTEIHYSLALPLILMSQIEHIILGVKLILIAQII